jgi:rRNA maturation RNase YbeY
LSFQNIDWEQPLDERYSITTSSFGRKSHFYFVSETEVTKINKSDSNNNIILLGDIIISCETIERERIEENKTFDEHLSFMTVHGILHLIGYDHEFEDDAAEMQILEKEIMSQIK